MPPPGQVEKAKEIVTREIMQETNNESAQWSEIIGQSRYTEAAVQLKYGFSPSSFRRWLTAKATPNKKNRERTASTMDYVKKFPRLQKHPSFGYATQEQIGRLNLIGLGPERDRIMKQIEFQNRTEGKIQG